MSESEDYKLLKEHRRDVKKVLASDIVWFAEELIDEKLQIITASNYREVTNVKTVMGVDDKAGIMWEALSNRVGYDPLALKTFVDVLKKKEVKFGELIGKLDRGATGNPGTSTEFNRKNVGDVLRDITDWETLGEKLQLPKRILRNIATDYCYKGNDRQKSEMLDKWFSFDTSKSWEKLCKALEEMDENDLAKKIREATH